MKKSSWLVSLAMVFSVLRPAVSAPMFPDVPDMWAKDAVAALAAKGVLEGYPDGTFKGDRAATRYEVALIVARLLAKMEQEHATFATKADLDEVRKLVNQLKEELDALGVRVQNLEDNVSKLDKRVTELERITFYGSIDARYVYSHVGSTGNTVGTGLGLAPNNGTAAGAGNPSYNNVVGSVASLSRGGGIFSPLTGTIGTFATVPGVLPVIDFHSGRPIVNGQGFSGEGVLGMRVKLNEDMDAGAEFASYWSAGDQIVDQFYGVSANRLSNAFAGIGGLGNGQSLDNTPYTRMNLDNFWFTHKPTGIKVQLGSYGDTNMDSMVYTPEFNPNVNGPKYLDNFGFRVSGSGHLLTKFDWEVFGTNVADGNMINATDAAAGASPYHPYLWGADIKWGWKMGEKDSANLKFNVMRIWDDTSAGTVGNVGLINNVNGVWTDWVNPNGYYVSQLSAAQAAGRATSTDARPILPSVAGKDGLVGVVGNIGGTSLGAAGMPASTFGPQSMFTWGLSAGWNHTFNDDFKLKLNGEYSNSDYKPSANSAYSAPTGTAVRVAAAGTVYKDFDLGAEYISVNPYHNPYILQYPNVAGLSWAYSRIPTLSWFPELYPVNDKDEYPNNREGFRVNFKWNPVDQKDGKRKTAVWAEYGSLNQNQTSKQQVAYSPFAMGAGVGNNGWVLGQKPGFIDTVFQGYSPQTWSGFKSFAAAVPGTNSFTGLQEDPRGRETNWGLGFNYRFDQLNGLALHVGYKSYEFKRGTALAAALGGDQNNVNLQLNGGLIGLQYPVNERLAVKAGYSWSDIKGHYDPLGLYGQYAAQNGVGFNTVNTTQTTPFVGFDYDVARNVNFNMAARFISNKDHLGNFTLADGSIFSSRNPFSWGGVMVTSQVKVSF